MRDAALVDEVTVLVGRDLGRRPAPQLRRGAQVVEDLHLVRLPLRGEEGTPLVVGPGLPHERVARRDRRPEPLPHHPPRGRGWGAGAAGRGARPRAAPRRAAMVARELRQAGEGAAHPGRPGPELVTKLVT